jgi:hypothetical protein
MTHEHLMRSQLLWCLMANILATLLSVSVLYLYPAGRGFTLTSGTTHAFRSRWAFDCCSVDDLRQYRDRRLPDVSRLRSSGGKWCGWLNVTTRSFEDGSAFCLAAKGDQMKLKKSASDKPLTVRSRTEVKGS